MSSRMSLRWDVFRKIKIFHILQILCFLFEEEILGLLPNLPCYRQSWAMDFKPGLDSSPSPKFKSKVWIVLEHFDSDLNAAGLWTLYFKSGFIRALDFGLEIRFCRTAPTSGYRNSDFVPALWFNVQSKVYLIGIIL